MQVLLDYADVVPGADARLLQHDLADMRGLVDRAVESVQAFYVTNPTFVGHQGKECVMLPRCPQTSCRCPQRRPRTSRESVRPGLQTQ